MPRCMLDTDTCSYIMKRSNDGLLKRLRRTQGQRRVRFPNHEIGAFVRG